jgi:Tn3 transposase DDE domain
MSRTIAQLRANGETIADEDLARVSPLAFAHVIPNGTYFVRQGQEAQHGSLRAPHDRQHDDA